jgi:F0F1-type ATP synthase delta subunit
MVNTVTDTQLLTTCITLVSIFLAMMVNNHRINDLRDVIRAEMRADRAETKAQFVSVDARFASVDARFASIEAKMDRNQETLLRILAEIDRRVSRLEERTS